MRDEKGNEIQIGDTVRVTAVDSSRGAYHMHTDKDGTVTRMGRSRVVVTFASLAGEHSIGNELVSVVRTVDGRTLRTWADARPPVRLPVFDDLVRQVFG